VGDQIEDVLRQHVQQATVVDRGEKAIEALESRSRSPVPANAITAYPFELSGGMCQRVVIALAAGLQSAASDRGRPTTVSTSPRRKR